MILMDRAAASQRLTKKISQESSGEILVHVVHGVEHGEIWTTADFLYWMNDGVLHTVYVKSNNI